MDYEEEKAHGVEAYKEFFKDARWAEAPGRIEFLGNHLDYNGGKVLGAAIDGRVSALAMPRDDGTIRLFSETFEDAVVETTLDDLSPREDHESWANYPLGILWALHEKGLAPACGFNLILTTNLPLSAGLSSSAAVELATALSLLQLGNHTLGKLDLARLCRHAENEFVGVPCGILDQGVSTHGEKGHLVLIDCRKESFSTLKLPGETYVWVFDTGIKHDLVDSLYATRNNECTEAIKRLQEQEGNLSCLAEVKAEMLSEAKLPNILSKRSRHVIEETIRVEQAIELLRSEANPKEIGSLLFASHESSRDLFENSCPELDFLVDDLKNRKGVLGARLTGGGFGGATLSWTNEAFTKSEAEGVARTYENKFGVRPEIHKFEVSDGARIITDLPKNT